MVMKKTYGWMALGVLVLLASLVGGAGADTAQNGAIDRHVIGSGGARLEQGAVTLDNTLGQPVVGNYHTGEAAVCVGFWCQHAVEYHFYIPVVLKELSG